jgi:hypothetical protein
VSHNVKSRSHFLKETNARKRDMKISNEVDEAVNKRPPLAGSD